jgi:hypothetical protein
MSPLADHIPIALPSFSNSKWELVRVSIVGQPGNWQKPNTSRLIAGSTSFKKKLFAMSFPKNIELNGIRTYDRLAAVMNTK